MSTETSVPHPRVSALDVSDGAVLETSLAQAPLGFAVFDPKQQFRRVNPTMAEITGFPVERHIGRRPGDILRGGLAETMEAALRKVLDEGRAVFDEARVETQTGSAEPRYWAFSWFPLRDGEDAIFGVALIAVDVTDRQRVEDEIRKSEERHRALVQASAQVVWVTSPSGEIIDDSPEWRSITGQTEEEYLGNGWLQSVHPDDRESTEQRWRDALRDRSVFAWSYRVRTRTGVYRYFDVRAVPIVRHGQLVEWVGANTDVTAPREAEEMRGRLTEQLSAAALRTARLQQATSMLAEALTVEQVVQVISDVGRSAIGAERSAVALLEPERAVLRSINTGGIPDVPGSPGEEIPLTRTSVLTLAVKSRRPFFAENTDSLRLQLAEAGADLGVVDTFLEHSDERAWVGLPLLAAGRALGALRFSFTWPRKISHEDGVFLEALAGQCALAVERATLFEREHRTAETLQRSLLPERLPAVPGLVLARRFRSGSRHVQVGGDWYDAFQLPDGRVAAVVGDVMGKGVRAAAGMGRVRNALRALALTDPHPTAVLGGLDRVFNATEDDEQVTSLAYVVIEPGGGQGVLGLAGHPPPLLAGPDRVWLCEVEPGTPLGWPSDRREQELTVAPGSTAVLYSDGLVENRRRGLDAGLDELVGVVSDAPPEVVVNAHMLLDFLVDRMLSGHEQDDDVTVLAVHVPSQAVEI